MQQTPPLVPFHILLADDDQDDRYFFSKAVEELPLQTQLTMVEDGAKLMTYLNENSVKLPDVLFLDYNMPRKNGFECLLEIKSSPALKSLPVIIYSTYVHDDVADILYKKGAHYYIRKAGHDELTKLIQLVLTLIAEKTFDRPPREKFILSLLEV